LCRFLNEADNRHKRSYRKSGDQRAADLENGEFYAHITDVPKSQQAAVNARSTLQCRSPADMADQPPEE
jgi:hypothetical protein